MCSCLTAIVCQVRLEPPKGSYLDLPGEMVPVRTWLTSMLGSRWGGVSREERRASLLYGGMCW